MQVWCDGTNIYPALLQSILGLVIEDVSHEDLSEFSRAFTNQWYSDLEPPQPGLVYMDDSGGFKTRAPINLRKREVDWSGSVHNVDNGFGVWAGFRYDRDIAFFWQSCNGNTLYAVPYEEGDGYKVSVHLSEGRSSCAYLEWFQSKGYEAKQSERVTDFLNTCFGKECEPEAEVDWDDESEE